VRHWAAPSCPLVLYLPLFNFFVLPFIHHSSIFASVAATRPPAAEDAAAGTAGVVAIPAAGTVDDEALISAVVRSTLWLMAADRKVTALKALQGRVWETGFASGALRGEFYGDVQPCLESWHRRGYKVRTRRMSERDEGV
jgi:hypothetical protein